MRRLFISDIHLDDQRPATTAAFIAAVRARSEALDALYLLGDVFERWVGDDEPSAVAESVAELTQSLAAADKPVYFMAGNRDFLLGQDYAERAGLTLLQDPHLMDVAGTPVLLSHGDAWCTDDVPYQQFRAQVRDPAWQRQFLAQPLTVRQAMAEQARAASAEHTQGSSAEIMDVNRDAVSQAMRDHGVQWLIHGHTHRPAVHRFDLDDQPATRIVLHDWYDDHGGILWFEDLEQWSLEPLGDQAKPL